MEPLKPIEITFIVMGVIGLISIILVLWHDSKIRTKKH
jgi:ABC-type antimicrobial peptide transport system permease subunit